MCRSREGRPTRVRRPKKLSHCTFPQLRRFFVALPACGTFRPQSEGPSCSLSDFGAISAEFGQMCLKGFEPWSPSSTSGGIQLTWTPQALQQNADAPTLLVPSLDNWAAEIMNFFLYVLGFPWFYS